MSRAIEPQWAVGLSSGTSMDGIDAALVRLEGGPGGLLELAAFRTDAYEPRLAAALRAGAEHADAEHIALLHVAVGEAFAVAAATLLEAAGVAASEVRCIGSHGQTLVHRPFGAERLGIAARASLQIGDPSVIAERTGITTVADFRSRDVAAGGQGAPLVPILDHRLYADAAIGRVALNIGGIANVTALPAGVEAAAVRAFDTGPGNVLLDAAARTRGLAAGFDIDGSSAAAGRVDEELVGAAMRHPFLTRRPPKSADAGDFLGSYWESLKAASDLLTTEDLLASLVAVTARTIAAAIESDVAPHQAVDEVIVGGGGSHNRALMRALGAVIAPARLRSAGDLGTVSADAKEAVLFALLATLTLAGEPGNIAASTGASGARVLGVIVPGRGGVA